MNRIQFLYRWIVVNAAVWVIGMLAACGSHPSVPEGASRSEALPAIFPDYTDVTVPCNIAPLNFMLSDTVANECVARFTASDGTVLTYGNGLTVSIDEEEWELLKGASMGKAIRVEVFGEKDGKWTAYKPFDIRVVKDSIDPFISYRLIQPSYGYYDKMSIQQRNVSNFEESLVFNNLVGCEQKEGQCINCHSYQNYKTENMLFHVRKTNGGTVFVVNGKVKKLDTKREGMISSAVYPSWHPCLPFVAFSTDNTHQLFHTSDRNKVEVFDDASDLVLYDVEKDMMSNISADTTRLEIFPTWTPDGKYLYYCAATRWMPDSTNAGDFRLDYRSLRYNLYRRSFDASSLRFGAEELVYRADSLGRSVSLPRISPDGRFLAFAEGQYGCFNIWHKEADIRVMELATGKLMPVDEMNSTTDAESYPSFSSNGRWIMCASRRDDGNYSRVYMAYFDGKKAHKAFLLPQADPEHNMLRLHSYNRPEFMVEPVSVSPSEFADAVLKK